jgi:2'-5' RNA ligase
VAAIVRDVRADLDREAPLRRSEVRWVRLEGLHVTLRFLGATDAGRIEAIRDAMEEVGRRHAPFDIAIAGAGAFPSVGRPRTLWLGLRDPETRLAALAGDTAGQLATHGWALPDRPFRPHLTLARADGRREGPAAARSLARRAAGVQVPVRIERIVLFESVTGGGPARYEPVAWVPLAAGGTDRQGAG